MAKRKNNTMKRWAIAGVCALAGGGLAYWGFSKLNASTSLRISVAEVKPSFANGALNFDITLDAQNPTKTGITVQSIDVQAYLNNSAKGSTKPMPRTDQISPQSTSKLKVPYSISLMDLGMTALDIATITASIASGKSLSEVIKGLDGKLNIELKGTVKAEGITVPFSVPVTF